MADTKPRVEQRPGSLTDTDAGFNYEADPVEDLSDPHVIPYHKPHERVRSDSDSTFRDEEQMELEDALREGKAMDFFKKAMKEETERREADAKRDRLGPDDVEEEKEPEEKPVKKVAAKSKK